MVYLMNSPVLGTYGTYRLSGPLSVQEVIGNLQGGFVSTIGHESTAQLIQQLTGLDVPVQRIRSELQTGDCAVVFRMTERLPEGVSVLTQAQLEALPYEFSLLERIS